MHSERQAHNQIDLQKPASGVASEDPLASVPLPSSSVTVSSCLLLALDAAFTELCKVCLSRDGRSFKGRSRCRPTWQNFHGMEQDNVETSGGQQCFRKSHAVKSRASTSFTLTLQSKVQNVQKAMEEAPGDCPDHL